MKKKKKVKRKKKAETLNLEQKRFCELYATEREFFGNGVLSYAGAYKINLATKGCYNTAKSNACRLLTNADILAYINKLLEDIALNDVHVDKQLAFLITQNADFGAKMSAIREFNALRQRITKKFEGKITFAQALHEAEKDAN